MGSKYKLLVVDDEESLRTILRDELTYQNYTVQDAENGLAALEILRREKQDIVLLDVRMPEMDGLELLRIIRKDNLARKVVMLTGVDELKIARESLQSGADDFITKPFQFQSLFACLDRVLKEA
jgi:DNA-binding response OmpR family regulator